MQVHNFIAAAIIWGVAAMGANAAPLKTVKLQIKEDKAHYSLEVSYPRTGLAAIDRVVEAWARKLAREFSEAAKDPGSRETPAWRAEITYEVARNDDAVFSLAFTYYSFSGGAHPNSSSETFHFLRPDGYQAELAEIFTPRGIARISAISIAQLKRDLAETLDLDWIKRGAGPIARNFHSFVLMPDQLVITFDAYQVAAYAAGPQEVRIPLANIKDTMRADVRAPAASFDCKLARSAVEQAICSSRDLARLDRHVGEAYAGKLTWAEDDKARAAVQQGQRDWLKERDGKCLKGAAALVSCLTPVYLQRLAVLEAE